MSLTSFFGFCKKSIPVFIAGILLLSCDDDNGMTQKVDFDRKAMLENWYDNILIPAFTDFNTEVDLLKTRVDNFAQNPNETSLNHVKANFVEAYKSFQKIKAFDAGPSENIALRSSVNTYPPDTNQISNNILAGNANLGSAENIDAKGFPALDYMLYGLSATLWTAPEGALSISYLQLITNEIDALAQQNLDDWKATRNNFVNASGTDVGSSLGQLVNAINKDYELIKNAKIGFPAGKKTLGKTFPKASEAYYSQTLSMELAAINCEAIHNFYKGISYNGSQDGLSLEGYLLELGTKSLGEPLDQLIDTRLREAIDAIRNIPTPFSDAVDNHKPAVDSAYTLVQQNVVLLKTDLPSALGVLITYQDNDGD